MTTTSIFDPEALPPVTPDDDPAPVYLEALELVWRATFYREAVEEVEHDPELTPDGERRRRSLEKDLENAIQVGWGILLAYENEDKAAVAPSSQKMAEFEVHRDRVAPYLGLDRGGETHG